MRIRSVLSHSFQAILEGAMLSLIVVALLAGTAFAAKGGPSRPGSGGSGTISLALMDGATQAEFGNRVTFNVSASSTAYPYVHLRCTQNGALVLESWQGFFPTALGNEWFYLGPTPAWQGGAADCTALLEQTTRKGTWSVIGSTTFHVAG